jgi:hypothetical protein
MYANEGLKVEPIKETRTIKKRLIDISFNHNDPLIAKVAKTIADASAFMTRRGSRKRAPLRMDFCKSELLI